MFQDFRSSQLLEFRKNLNDMLKAFDFACRTRANRLEFTSSTSKYEYAKYEQNECPQNYYHYQFFDKVVCINRVQNSRDWLIEDDDHNYMHFTISCYNFTPKNFYSLKCHSYYDHTNYGEWLSIEDTFKYFYQFCNDLFLYVTGIHAVTQLEIF